MSEINLRCLVLNKSYLPHSVFPLSVIPVQDAIVNYLNGKTEVIFWYNRIIKTPSRNDLRWPSVIVTKKSRKKDNYFVKLGKQNLLIRDSGKCFWCDTPLNLKTMTFDHLVPKSHGGKNEWENLVSCCKKCNTQKGNSLPVGRWKPNKKVIRPTYFQLLEFQKEFPIVVDDLNWIQFLPHSVDNIKVKSDT